MFPVGPNQQAKGKTILCIDSKCQKQTPNEAQLTAKGDQRQYVKHNYTDRSHDYGDVNYAKRYHLVTYDDTKEGESDGSSSKKSQTPSTQILQSPTFPLKLHMILEHIENTGSNMKNAISWLPHGRAFHIRNADVFKREVLPKYFKHCKLSSFYRQINLYGFVRLTTGCETGAYYHEYFLRGRAFLTKHVVRTKVKGTKIRPTSAPENEPNLYAMTPVCAEQLKPVAMPLGEALTSVVPRDDSVALLAAMRDRDIERSQISAAATAAAATANGQSLYNALPYASQTALLGTMEIPRVPRRLVNHSPMMSMYDQAEYNLVDKARSPYDELLRTSALQNGLATAGMQNELSRAYLRNEYLRDARIEIPRTVFNNETVQNDIQYPFHQSQSVPFLTNGNSLGLSQMDELQNIAQILRMANMRNLPNRSIHPNSDQNHT